MYGLYSIQYKSLFKIRQKKVCFPNDRKKWLNEVEISCFQNEQTCANARHFRVPAESVANETGKTMGQ